MRRPEYLSHTALEKWQYERDEFYMRYLADRKAPRQPQEQAMSVGSAFDAYVKSELILELHGTPPEGYDLETMFESQVEPQNRDFARKAGEHCLECYRYSGMYDELLALMEKSRDEPRFEFTLKGVVDDIPILGKPDCKFTHEAGFMVLLDWKARGYCSKYNQSPTKGYRLCKDGQVVYNKKGEEKPNRSHNKAHTGYLERDHKGLGINTSYLEASSEKYASQLCVYGWLMDIPVGDEDAVYMIDELCCKYVGIDAPPLMRVANHRARISSDFQHQTLGRYRECWNAIQSGIIFGTTVEESKARTDVLDQTARQLTGTGDIYDEMTRIKSW